MAAAFGSITPSPSAPTPQLLAFTWAGQPTPAAAVAEKAEVAAEVTATGAMTAMATAEATEAARRRGGRRRPTTGEVGPPGVTTDLDPDLIHHVFKIFLQDFGFLK